MVVIITIKNKLYSTEEIGTVVLKSVIFYIELYNYIEIDKRLANNV